MAFEKIVAFYDRSGKARDAARALETSGFSSSDINVLNRDSVSDQEVRDGNLWQRLFGRTVSEREGEAYRRTLESGGAVLTLRTAEPEVSRAMSILQVHGPMDFNSATGETTAGDVRTDSREAAIPPSAGVRTDAREAAAPPSAGTRTEWKEEVLRLAEEQLSLGKRQIATGKSRIRRFVVEKPVESQITLHEEHCEVARRPAADSAVKDIDWKDQIIEVVETSEQPVVTKTARIAEEVVIRRRGSDHVETVRDTVRRQQIEVERVASDVRDLRDVRDSRDVKKAA
jgi:uncharacterized protein (TIGR02271 family)